nr:hypothetical protein [uncultured Cohaesibacter sp.]
MDIRLFYLRDTIAPTLVNIAIAFGIAYGQTAAAGLRAPFATTPSAIIEFIPGTFMPAFLIALVGTYLTRRAIRTGTIAAISGRFSLSRQSCLVRGLLIGAITTLIFAPLSGLLAHQFYADMTARGSIIFLMCVNAAILGLIVAPLAITAERTTSQTVGVAAQTS